VLPLSILYQDDTLVAIAQHILKWVPNPAPVIEK